MTLKFIFIYVLNFTSIGLVTVVGLFIKEILVRKT